MTRSPIFRGFLLASAFASLLPRGRAVGGDYTRLTPVSAQILAAAPAFPGDYAVANLLKPAPAGGPHPEYASHGQGAKTFIDLDLGAQARVAAFRHVQRRTPDLVAEAELVFSDTADFRNELARVPVRHQGQPGATSFATFPPVAAQYVRWQVKSLTPGSAPNVGGQSIEFFSAAAEVERTPSATRIEAQIVPIVRNSPSGRSQPLEVILESPYAEEVQASLVVEGQAPRQVTLAFGRQTLTCDIPAPEVKRTLTIRVEAGGEQVATRTIELEPARKLTVYILPHSHTDIGYTAIQTDIEEKQVNNLLQGLADARRTADYPAGARFVWNVEVLWAARLFLDRLPDSRRAEFLEGVRSGQIALNGMYLNELTGLCRPEELVRLFREATRLGEQTGVPVDSAMISDVPGYTWGTVTAMAQAGIRYFSVAPNYFDRIGDILVQWENRPFWWVGPDGSSRVLVWIPFRGYAMSMLYRQLSPRFVREYCEGLERRAYPYEIAYIRWAGIGDNAVPDASICDFVRDWNAEHASPRFVIASTSEAFRAFEQRYGDQLPQVRGDWTPYWEDGAGSSAAETALNRASSERLAQAETLWAMSDPAHYPAARFDRAWNHILLYSEHTWGAHCSITRPASPFTTDQWTIKQSYATAANLQSRQLLGEATQAAAGFAPSSGSAAPAPEPEPPVSQIDIYNTSSWPQTEVVLLPRELSDLGNFVTDTKGQPVPSQRLASDELAVLVRDIPPLSGRRFRIQAQGATAPLPRLAATSDTLANDRLSVRLDTTTGAIVELRAEGVNTNLVDTAGGHALNDYLYLPGDDLAALQRNGPVKISVRDNGPLVASLLVESDAPGCHRLSREIRLVAGADHVELLNTVDKKRLDAPSYLAKEGKESVNFAFPFRVPEGEVRLDVPLGVIRPETDQIPGSCKNWLTLGRWADVANPEFGVTWVSLDAPLVQIGGITATKLNSQTDPSVWIKKLEPSQKLYSWAMNNHWGTNYRAYQEGPVLFRFVLRPHRGRVSDAEATRFATAFSQPLVAVPGRGQPPCATPLFQLEPADVIVTGLKPSDDGKALIIRLLGVSDQARSASLTWGQPSPPRLSISDTSERPVKAIEGEVPMPAWGIVTLRAELPQQ